MKSEIKTQKWFGICFLTINCDKMFKQYYTQFLGHMQMFLFVFAICRVLYDA